MSEIFHPSDVLFKKADKRVLPTATKQPIVILNPEPRDPDEARADWEGMPLPVKKTT